MTVCAAVMFALTFGIRSPQPLFIGPINTATGAGLAAISFAFAIGQLMWGARGQSPACCPTASATDPYR